MHVHAASVAHSHAAAAQARRAETPEAGKPGQPASAQSPASAPARRAGDSVELSGATPGVIRLLEAGHFKGVADVRLRINLHEQLTARQTPAQTEAPEPAAQFAAVLDGEVEPLLAEQTLDEAQQEALTQLRQGLRQEIEQAQTAAGDGGTIRGALATAGQTFIDAAATLLTPETTGPEAPDAGAVADDAAEEVADTPANALREALVAALQTALASLDAEPAPVDTAPAITLPPLTPPRGNGGAYDKFLAQYQQLIGAAATAEQAPGDPVDLVA